MSDPVTAALLDDAIAALARCARLSAGERGDRGIDPEMFDAPTLQDLDAFLHQVRDLAIAPDEAIAEARLWKRAVELGWRDELADTAPVRWAIERLTVALPATAAEPLPLDPVNDLERALLALDTDPAARPELLAAFRDAEVVVPVLACDVTGSDGMVFQLLTLPEQDRPVVLGFTSRERLEALWPDGVERSSITPQGRDLPSIWPADHWLLLNFGYCGAAALSPEEIAADGP